jgi:DNA-directed RNA polymerase subunit L|tara:strand:+ start:1966 stop:3129 length:1164 start_codon:yes stop_codon:yes gene_type:complete
MNNHFKNIEISDDIELKMNIYNLDTCIVNSFRRIVLSDVVGIAFDNIIIQTNTSIINNEILSHRLSLIPLEIDIDNIDNICVELDVSNSDYDKMFVTSSDLKVISGKIDIIPNILLVELRHGEKISLKMYPIKGNGKKHAKFQPVSVCCFKINEDVRIKEEIWNKLSESSKKNLRKYCKDTLSLNPHHYLYDNSVGAYGFKNFNENTKNKIVTGVKSYLVDDGIMDIDDSVIFNDQYYNKKYVYSFKLESHLVDPYNIFSKILYQFNQKIIDLQNKDIEIDNQNCLAGVCFVIEGEGHTIGNILSRELQKDDRVKYSYYKMKHPFDRKIMLYLILNDEKSDETKYAKVLADSFKRIVKINNDLQTEWEFIFKAHEKQKLDNQEMIEI